MTTIVDSTSVTFTYSIRLNVNWCCNQHIVRIHLVWGSTSWSNPFQSISILYTIDGWMFYQFKLSSIKLGSLISMVCLFDESATHSFSVDYAIFYWPVRLGSSVDHFSNFLFSSPFLFPLFQHFWISVFSPSANCGICSLHVSYKFFGWGENQKLSSSNVLCLLVIT